MEELTITEIKKHTREYLKTEYPELTGGKDWGLVFKDYSMGLQKGYRLAIEKLTPHNK